MPLRQRQLDGQLRTEFECIAFLDELRREYTHHGKGILLVMGGLLGLCALGIWMFNEPFDPAKQILPRIYFSDDWRWEPGAMLKPRREVWGGFLLALTGLVAYTRWGRRDPLAPRLALWGVAGGALGFPLGQCLQAFHAWNREWFQSGLWAQIDPLINWWNFMETTFGAVMGAVLGLGLWLNCRRIGLLDETPAPTLLRPVEWFLVALHVGLLTVVEFTSVPGVDFLYDFGLVMGLIPVVGVAGGRWFPYLVLLPITALPIAGKTLRQLAYREHSLPLVPGWILYLVLPLALATVGAILFCRAAERGRRAGEVLRPTLLLCAWLYFGLNFAFFHFPWPWSPWTTRTPNGMVFGICALGLTWMAVKAVNGARRQP